MLNLFGRQKPDMPTEAEALPGRAMPIATDETHFISGRPLHGPIPEGHREIMVAMGCFWGAERVFWQLDGVYVTSVGYAGGFTPNPTYQETCTGQTGHTEIVRIVYDPAVLSLSALLQVFWENHDPTQGMRQGNDMGSQYRSAIYVDSEADYQTAITSRDAYQKALIAAGLGTITTEIGRDKTYYWAEDYHQQYLAKNPAGYCGIGGTGVTCPIGTGA